MTRERLLTPEQFFRTYPPATDNDGVMSDTRAVVVEEFNRRFGTNHTVDEVNKWNIVTIWSQDLGMSPEEAKEVDKSLWYDPDLLINAQPVPGAVEFTRTLSEYGIIIPVISTRPPVFKPSTIEWYHHHMPWIPSDQIYLRQNSEMSGPIFKAWMIRILGRKVFFEDVPDHAKTVLDYTDCRVVFISNSGVLDHYDRRRLIRVPGVNGSAPDMRPVSGLMKIGFNLI